MQEPPEYAESLYVILWEFHVRSGMEGQFEEVYGPEGNWAAFFRKGEGYLRTELFRDAEHKHRYVIMDVWVSEAAFESFREKWLAEYKALDKTFEGLTEREHRLGAFHTVGRSRLLPQSGQEF